MQIRQIKIKFCDSILHLIMKLNALIQFSFPFSCDVHLNT